MELSKSKIFLLCCLAFLAGIAAASYCSWLPARISALWWFGVFVLCGAAAVLFWRFRRARTAFLVCAFFCCGLWRYGAGLPAGTPDKIWHYNGRTVMVTGMVANEPDVRQTNRKLEIAVRHLNYGARDDAIETQNFASLRDISGKILVTTGLYPEYSYGDELEIKCNLEAPEEFEGFAYDRYLARFDIYSVCYYPQIKKTAAGGNGFYRVLFAVKAALRAKIDLGLSEPSAGLARATILGDRGGLPADLQAAFARAGISHIIAISGTHISILAALVMGALLGAGLKRRHAFYLSIVFLAVYLLLIGLPASAMRAGVMGFLVLWALELGRLNKLTNSLVLAAAVMLLINPRLLRDDIGFELSFLAVAGMAYFYPFFDGWLVRRMEKLMPRLRGSKALGAVTAVLAMTMAAQIFTLPVIAYDFSIISLVAPLANLLVLWIFPPLMVSIMAAMASSFVLPGLGAVFFAPAWLLLEYLVKIGEWTAAIPGSCLEVADLWPGWALFWYLFWAGLIWRVKKTAGRDK